MASQAVDNMVSTFTAHSNLSVICRKYGISRQMVKECLEEKLIEVTDVSIPFKTEKDCAEWDTARKGIIEAISTKLLGPGGIGNSLVITASGTEFTEIIADEVIQQIKSRYKNQGMMNWLTESNNF